MHTFENDDGQSTVFQITVSIDRREYVFEHSDIVFAETLRKHSIAPSLFRITNAPYTIPETNITLEAGTRVLLSVMGLHNDPKYFPDPEKFDPERFSEEEKAQRPSFTYLPFGEGPRFCIGKYLEQRFTSANSITPLLRK